MSINFRSGIPKARMAGAQFATGEVLLFLDAHCECMTQWLEPLVDRIRISRTNVVVPLIDAIDAETLEYQIGDVGFYEVSKVCNFAFELNFKLNFCSWVDSPGTVTLIGFKFRKENEHDNVKNGPTKNWRFCRHKVQLWPEDCLLLIESTFGRLEAMMTR